MAGSISATTATIIAASIGAATTAASIGYQMSQGSHTAPSSSTTQQQQSEAASAAAQAQAEALQKRRGMASTILTSPMGTGSANIAKETLG